MARRGHAGARPLQAIESLCTVRRIEEQQSEGRLLQKQVEIARLRRELEGLKGRRQRASQRIGGDLLRSRLLLDALLRISLERGRELEALSLQTAILLEDCREAKRRAEAVHRLRDRRLAERELVATRRAEGVAADLAAALRRREEAQEEERCEA